MKIVFRVDASVSIGTGHVERCRTLAQALHERGVEVGFICREHTGHMIESISKSGFQVDILPAPHKTYISVDNYESWLGVSQQTDAIETIAVLGEKPDWLIVDHYSLDIGWESALRPHIDKIMVIDDLANRLHNCDLLLDQNYSENKELRYQSLVPNGCKILTGMRYALLRPEYSECRRIMNFRTGDVKRVLIYFGGTDNTDITGSTLQMLISDEFDYIEVDVVIGPNYSHKDKIEKLAKLRSHTNVYSPRLHLADLMALADLAIGAGGSTTLERLCMGLPSCVISLADNQKSICEALSRAGLIHYMGNIQDFDACKFSDELTWILNNINELRSRSLEGQALVDGYGTERICEVLLPTDKNKLKLRPVREEDVLLYYLWANDPIVRKNAFNSASIDIYNHIQWFNDRLNDPNTYMSVLEAGKMPVGQIRFDCASDEARIDYSLDPLIRGRGWANELVRLGVQNLHLIKPVTITAEVKPKNIASLEVFRHLGFEEMRLQGESDKHFFRLPPLQTR